MIEEEMTPAPHSHLTPAGRVSSHAIIEALPQTTLLMGAKLSAFRNHLP
jgi:hypothetical protein